jgi:tetratricopeptide (TPR) repeat protein
LNEATVAQEYFHDNKLALQNYRAYLALSPRRENWDAVNAIVNGLEQPATVASANPPPQTPSQNSTPNPPPAANEVKPQTASAAHQTSSPRTQPVIHTNSNQSPRPAPSAPEVVNVQPEPVMVTTPKKNTAAAEPEIELPPEPAPERHGFFHKLNPAHWFDSSPPEKKYANDGVTPLPKGDSANNHASPSLPPSNSNSTTTIASPGTPEISEQPVKIVSSAPPTFPRYLYLSPRKPKSGDRVAASGAFTKAREFEQDSRWTDAMEWYRRATESDPTWFEAQYNYGVLAYRLQNYPQALAAYELALADAPDSTNALNARYQFALALKAAGYAVDAVNELKKIVAANPDEVRAHLALGNLYAQQLHDNANARKHYLKVLALDPRNPQATDIRFWLSSNPA